MGQTKTQSAKPNDFFNKISPLYVMLQSASMAAIRAKLTSALGKLAHLVRLPRTTPLDAATQN